MMLTTKGRYAVMALVDLAAQESESPVTLAAIAERQEIALPYLEQIFAKLRRSGLVDSVRGPGGGYALARGAEKTFVSDVILAVEESIKMTRCEKESAAGCMKPKTRCLTHDLWEGLGNQIYDYLRAISLKDVIDRQVLVRAA
jgi:Rrf2 family iron-sulfur cluster assembly transcriptional regulator